jgi:hypothetical protein
MALMLEGSPLSRKNLKTSLASELIFPQQRFVADMVVTMALLQAKKNSQHGRYFGGTAKKSGPSLRQSFPRNGRLERLHLVHKERHE